MPKSVFTAAYSELLTLLVETRKAAGVTQVQLAKRLNRPQPFVSYLERGERRIDVIEFVAVARALEVDPAELFGRLLSRLPDQIEV
jgi:transcriptional regulator with XRE-family HTH domain